MRKQNQGNDIELCRIVGRSESLAFPADARNKHLYVCGTTDSGKSKFLERLIRQDIAQWSKSKCGLLVIDPHGSLHKSLLNWLAWHPHLANRPIIPIDFSQNERSLAYNVLRKRQANPAVIVDAFVQAMAYVWGAYDMHQTPLLARWASNTMRALYENGLTLADAVVLMDRRNAHLRNVLTSRLRDKMCAQDWAYANGLTPKDFDLQISSTLNRLGAFVRNENMQTTFGQSDVSLDMGQVLANGAIVLVSLSLEHGHRSREDADLFATLLLNDLWTAAQERGKSNKVKPFYVYIDEAQRFVTPTIAENLDQARGFGLHLTLATQYPGQCLAHGEPGKQLYDSIMENTGTKVAFRLASEDNLKPVAQWLFRGTMDPDEIKLKLYSTKVMDYRLEMRESYTRSHNTGHGGGKFAGQSSGHGVGDASSFDPEHGEIMAESDSMQESWTHASGESESWSESNSESVTQTPMMVPVLGTELTSVQYRSLDEQLHRAMAALFEQRQRHCVARIADRMHAPAFLETPMVNDPPTTDAMLQRFLKQQYDKWPFFLSMVDAVRSVKDRNEKLIHGALAAGNDDEPTTARRRLPSP